MSAGYREALLERDQLWCKALVKASQKFPVPSLVVEDVTRVFNELRQSEPAPVGEAACETCSGIEWLIRAADENGLHLFPPGLDHMGERHGWEIRGGIGKSWGEGPTLAAAVAATRTGAKP